MVREQSCAKSLRDKHELGGGSNHSCFTKRFRTEMGEEVQLREYCFRTKKPWNAKAKKVLLEKNTEN